MTGVDGDGSLPDAAAFPALLSADVEGLRITYRRAGTGPPLVLLHGAWMDSRAWWHQLASLSDEFSVIAWDAPGFGGSQDPPETFRLPDYAEVLAGLIRALGLGHPHVLGLSFGGGLALELYRRHPDLAATLLLAGAYAGWAGSLPPEVVEQRLERFLREIEDPEDHIRGYIREFFTASADPEDVATVLAMMGEVRRPGMEAITRGFAAADLRDVLPRIAIPTLLLWGDADVRSPMSIAREFAARIPGAELAVLPGVGHLSNVDAPAGFDAAVRRFLRSHAA
jgi:pimeloyl-ACP methyl ester carboxylesterase